MSAFFTLPSNGLKKRKRPIESTERPKKRVATSKSAPPSKPPPISKPPPRKPKRDESISGSEDESDVSLQSDAEDESDSGISDSPEEADTAASRRLKLAEQYLSNIRDEVAEQQDIGFDAAEIDRDLIADRLREDVAESKGKMYRHLVEDLDFGGASHCLFGWDGGPFTGVAVCHPWVYTVSKDLGLGKWRVQDLPRDQWVRKQEKGGEQREKEEGKRKRRKRKKKSKKSLPPPKKAPEQVAFTQGNQRKAKDNTYRGHTDIILCVAASQDGKFVVTGGRDRKMIVWDAEILRPLKVFTQHRDAVTGLAFRRGTNQLYSSSKDRTVKTWSLNELAYVETLFGHQDEVVDIAALSQERCISVGARDRSARLWKVVEETQLVFRGGGPSTSTFTSQTSSSSKKSKDKTNSSAGPAIALECSLDRIAMVDEEMFVTGGDNGTLSLWLTHKKKPVFTLPLAHGVEEPLKPDEASAEQNPEGENIVPQAQPRWITALTTVPYSDLVLSGSWDGWVRVWRVSTDKKKVEACGVLGKAAAVHRSTTTTIPRLAEMEDTPNARGVINDLAVFERGERGKDGICVVAALGKQHRLGRWQKDKGKNGAIVFEVSKKELLMMNGVHKEDADNMDDAE